MLPCLVCDLYAVKGCKHCLFNDVMIVILALFSFCSQTRRTNAWVFLAFSALSRQWRHGPGFITSQWTTRANTRGWTGTLGDGSWMAWGDRFWNRFDRLSSSLCEGAKPKAHWQEEGAQGQKFAHLNQSEAWAARIQHFLFRAPEWMPFFLL